MLKLFLHKRTLIQWQSEKVTFFLCTTYLFFWKLLFPEYVQLTLAILQSWYSWLFRFIPAVKLGYKELDYNELGYNEHLVITNKYFGPK